MDLRHMESRNRGFFMPDVHIITEGKGGPGLLGEQDESHGRRSEKRGKI